MIFPRSKPTTSTDSLSSQKAPSTAEMPNNNLGRKHLRTSHKLSQHLSSDTFKGAFESSALNVLQGPWSFRGGLQEFVKFRTIGAELRLCTTVVHEIEFGFPALVAELLHLFSYQKSRVCRELNSLRAHSRKPSARILSVDRPCEGGEAPAGGA